MSMQSWTEEVDEKDEHFLTRHSPGYDIIFKGTPIPVFKTLERSEKKKIKKRLPPSTKVTKGLLNALRIASLSPRMYSVAFNLTKSSRRELQELQKEKKKSLSHSARLGPIEVMPIGNNKNSKKKRKNQLIRAKSDIQVRRHNEPCFKSKMDSLALPSLMHHHSSPSPSFSSADSSLPPLSSLSFSSNSRSKLKQDDQFKPNYGATATTTTNVNVNVNVNVETNLDSSSVPSLGSLNNERKNSTILATVMLGGTSIVSLMTTQLMLVNTKDEITLQQQRERRLLGLQRKTQLSSNAIGLFLGWLSVCIYIGLRVPQLRLLFKTKYVSGMHTLFFLFTLLGNFTQMTSIIVKREIWIADVAFILRMLPWVIISGFCFIQDSLIIIFVKLLSVNRQQQQLQFMKE